MMIIRTGGIQQVLVRIQCIPFFMFWITLCTLTQNVSPASSSSSTLSASVVGGGLSATGATATATSSRILAAITTTVDQTAAAATADDDDAATTTVVVSPTPTPPVVVGAVAEERYSRQSYTLGVQAQQQIRSPQTLVVLDDAGSTASSTTTTRRRSSSSSSSGLLYETAKNLALMGVRNLVVVEPPPHQHYDTDERKRRRRRKRRHNIHNNKMMKVKQTIGGRSTTDDDDNDDDDDDDGRMILDDLGRMVLPPPGSGSSSSSLVGQLRAMNPTITVTAVPDRRAVWELIEKHQRRNIGECSSESNNNNKAINTLDDDLHPPAVVYVVTEPRDRGTTTTTATTTNHNDTNDTIIIDEINTMTRRYGIKCIVVETIGVFGRIMCDLGPAPHTVVDADGEVPLVVPLARVEPIITVTAAAVDANKNNNNSTTTTIGDAMIVVHAVEGERHDVSKGETVEFRTADGTVVGRCRVEQVLTPMKFRATTTTMTTTATTDDATTMTTSPATTTTTTAGQSLVDAIQQQQQQGTALTFRRVKMPMELSYLPLREALARAAANDNNNDDLFTPCDLIKSFDPVRRNTIMAAFAAVFAATDRNDFFQRVRAQLSVPRPTSSSLGDATADDGTTTLLLRQFWRGRHAKFAPVQAILGAVAAQETIKAITGVYTPIRQIMLFDADEVLQVSPDDNDDGELCQTKNDAMPSSSSSSGLRTLLGDAVVDRLHDTNVFVVGAGAIGCELLKNLAALHVGAAGSSSTTTQQRQRGKVVVTDMDTIEASNLSRQLLFREGDLGKFKSLAAKEAIARLNPTMKVEAHSSRVGATKGGGDSSTPFDEAFWSEQDIILNALDNVEARLYMDGQCVSHRKALVDAGTMGSKGNVQVVVPFQSESYASSADPPEPAIPVCTLKSFPYAISHTIQWGKELFEQVFQRRPVQANAILDQLEHEHDDIKTVIRAIFQGHGADRAVEIASEVAQDLEAVRVHNNNNSAGDGMATVQAQAIAWAADLAHCLFYEAAVRLLEEHPIDSKDDDGEPFWTGTRRPPKPLVYAKQPLGAHDESINQNLVDFVQFAARLRMETLQGNPVPVDQSIALDKIVVALTMRRFASAACAKEGRQETPPEKVRRLLGGAKSTRDRMLPIEFEKDVEANGHVAFIAASSNLRAIAYGIPPVSIDETRRVAGKIIPAMVTTTALVSGLSCIELIKLVQKRELPKHRNAFVNLALPFFAFTAPVPADTMPGVQGRSYTLWDRIDIREGPVSHAKGGISMKHMLETIKAKAAEHTESVEVASISYGPFMIYTNFLHESDDEILNEKLWSLLQGNVAQEDETTSDFDPEAPYFDFDVVLEDVETGEAVELPPVRVHRFMGKRK